MAVDLTCSKCGRYFQVASLGEGGVLECPACGTRNQPSLLEPEPGATPDFVPHSQSQDGAELGQRRDLEPHRGPLIMVLGIVSLVMIGFIAPLGIPFGIAAWIMGRKDLKKILAGEMDPDGESKTNAGRLCGLVGFIISTVITLFICTFYSLLIGMVFTVAPASRRAPPPFPKVSNPAPPPVENRPPPPEKDDAPNP